MSLSVLGALALSGGILLQSSQSAVLVGILGILASAVGIEGLMLLFVLLRAFGALAFVVGVAGLLLGRARGYLGPPSACAGRPLQIAWVAYAVLLLVVFVPRMRNRTIIVSQGERSLLAYISTLPKDVLIAGDPEVMSGIPLFAQRSVFLSGEISYVGDERVKDFFDAYYAERREDVYAFCEKYGVDYLVVNQGHFSAEYLARGDFFYEPHNGYVVDLTAGRTRFSLASIPREEIAFSSGDLLVWQCTSGE